MTREDQMKAVEFEDGAVQIDAAIVAEGLGMLPPDLLARMQDGRVTGVCEHGIDADRGRHRLTFFSGNRRFRVVVDQSGAIVQRSTLDFGDRPLPATAHRRGV
jgi:hypothetical protein